MSAVDLSVSGLASGFDWKAVVNQLIQVERIPEQRLQSDQAKINQRNNAYGAIKDQISALNTRLQTLKEPAFYDGRTNTVGDSTILSATAATGAAIGTYTFNITHLGKAAALQGSANVASPLNATNDVSALAIKSAKFATPVTAGTFSVNGQQVTIFTETDASKGQTADTLQSIFDKISTATGGTVTASYDSASDKITLSSAGPITLGSAADTSNFLTIAKLNTGAGPVSSTDRLGSIVPSSSLASANFATAVTDGGSGAGEFKVNGISIKYNATTDSVNTVLQRINDSAAGVTASYDTVNRTFVMTNKVTGNIGLSVQDVTGNFMAAAGLATGTFSSGEDLQYTMGSDPTVRTSHSNLITQDSSGISGLSVNALKLGTTTVTVAADTGKVKTAINDFLTEYNKTQSLLASLTATTTDAKGKVSKSVLSGESDADDITTTLRRSAFSSLSGLAGNIKSLADLGIDSNGNDDSLALKNSTKLDDALATNFNSVKDFFTHVKSGAEVNDGLAVTLANYADKTAGGTSLSTGTSTLETKQANLSKQAADITTQIANLERTVLANKDRLTASFVAMETAQAKINQQLQYLTKRFG